MKLRMLGASSLAAGLVLGAVTLPASGTEGSGGGAAQATTAANDHRGAACPGAPGTGFADVPSGNVHRAAIELGVLLGVIEGTGPDTFAPRRSVTRGQIASLIARSLDAAQIDLPPLAGAPNFPDIGPPHGNNIRRLAAAGIVEGREDGRFRTSELVRRDQLASLLVRTVEYATGQDITPDRRRHFTDVRDGVHADNVNAAFELGLVQGKTDGRYDPRGDTRRDQAASVITRLLDAVHLPHEGEADVTLLHDTHLHGKYVQDVGFPAVSVDIARYFTLVEERKEAADGEALFLANGDDIGPSVYSGLFEPNGIHMVDALNQAPVDVNTLGNHEFDYGPDNLRAIIAAAEYPYVTANVRDIATCEVFGADLGVEEFLIFEVDGVDVGVTGLAPEGMASITSMGPDTEQLPAAQALDLVIPKMRAAGADVIVVSSHLCGTDAIALADSYEGVDLLAGDHCAAVLEEPYVADDGTIVSLVADEYEYLGELVLNVEDGEVSGFDWTLFTMVDEVAGLEQHEAIQQVVDEYDEQLDEQLNVVIGEREVAWDTRTTEVRVRENAAGNFFTDEMRAAFGGSDIAVTNSGGIRGNQIYPEGDVIRRDIAEIFPFGNRLVQAEISGETLLEALEWSVRLVPAPNGGFLQVSGMEFTFDSTLPAGSRVIAVTIGGQPLDPTATYTMATNDFTLGGGDGFDMFANDTTVLVDSNAGPVLDSYLIDRIEARDGAPITTDVEGRIVNLAP